MLVLHLFLKKVKICGAGVKSCGCILDRYMSPANIQSQRLCKNKIRWALLKICLGKNFLNISNKAIMTALPPEE